MKLNNERSLEWGNHRKQKHVINKKFKNIQKEIEKRRRKRRSKRHEKWSKKIIFGINKIYDEYYPLT